LDVKLNITSFFAVIIAIIALLAAWGWYAGVPGAKELLMFILGGIIGIVNPAPAKETIEISVPANYRVEVQATVRQE